MEVGEVETSLVTETIEESKDNVHIDDTVVNDEITRHHQRDVDDEDSNRDDEDDNLIEEGEEIENENTEETTHLIPIVNSSGAITYQSPNGTQQYSLSLPAENVANVKIVKVVPLPHARSEVWSYFGFIADDDGEIQDKKKAICKICASTLAYSGNTTNLFTHLKSMHPEANPQKLAPTNRTPRTGKKLGKRKFIELSDFNGLQSNKTIIASSPTSQQYVIRAITYSGNSNNNEFSSVFIDNDSNGNSVNTNSNSNESKTNVKTVVINNVITTDNEINLDSSQLSESEISSPVISSDEITSAIVTWLVKDCRPLTVVEGKGFDDLIKLLAPGYKIPEKERLKILMKKKYEEVRRKLILRVMDEA